MSHPPGFLALVSAAKQHIRETTIEEIAARRARGEAFHLVDTREDDEWRGGRIAGAIHLGKGVIERDIEAKIPDPDADIVLYCGGGFRSALAAEALQNMGYTKVSSMDGGYRAWKTAGLPLDTE